MKILLRNVAIVTIAVAAMALNVQAQFGARAASEDSAAREAAARAVAAKIEQAAAQPTPKVPNGHPDLAGYWAPANGGNEGVFGPQRSLDLTGKQAVTFITEDDEINGDAAAPKARWANKSLRPTYKSEFAKKQEEQFFRADYLDPSFRCQPEGVPRIGAPTQILVTPTEVVFLYQHRNLYRVIPTDGRGHDKNADAMAMGDSIGRWEGDTLVVDVVNFSPDTWIDHDGSWHDDNLHVTESFTRKGNTLTYAVKMEDPTLFAEPFTPKPVTLILGALGKHADEDYPCVEEDQPHFVGTERH
jgi:hypothetical protein